MTNIISLLCLTEDMPCPFNIFINMNNFMRKKVINSKLYLCHTKSLNYGISKLEHWECPWNRSQITPSFHKWENWEQAGKLLHLAKWSLCHNWTQLFWFPLFLPLHYVIYIRTFLHSLIVVYMLFCLSFLLTLLLWTEA